MTPIEKIDTILIFLKERADLNASFSKEYIWNLYVKKMPELHITRQIFDEILNKLVEDGYVKKELRENSQPTFHLTMSGYLFDGYLSSKNEMQKLQQTAIFLSKRTFCMTVVIAVGTGIAAIYYIIEILNHFFCIYPK